MAKKKNSTALFEAISKSKEKSDRSGLNAPGWAGKDQQGEPEQSAGDSPPAANYGGGYDGGPRVVLSGAGLILALALALAVAAAAFMVGRWTAPGENAVSGPRQAGADPARNADGGATLPARVVNKQYHLVIQRMLGTTDKDRREANDIADWLVKQKSEPCEVRTITIRTGRDGQESFLGVWSPVAFDSYTSPEATKYAERIEALGKEYKTTAQYKRSTGKYNFSQHRQGKLDPYYIGYKGP